MSWFTPRSLRPCRHTRGAVCILALLAAALLPGGGATSAADAPSQPAEPRPGPPAANPTPELRPNRAPVLQDLETRLDLRDPFNLGQGKVRIVAFLSPSCTHCIANAQSLQEVVLDKLDTPDLAVHIVWLEVNDPDDRNAAASAASTLRDPRIHHYWDARRSLNAQLLDAIQFEVHVRMYDVFLLYDRKIAWEKRLPRPGYWMHEYRGAPGPKWNAATFATQVANALAGEPLESPKPD